MAGRFVVNAKGKTVRASGSATARIDVEGIGALTRALKVLGETDAPHLREGLEKGAGILHGAAVARAGGSIGQSIEMVGIRGKGGALRYVLRIRHKGGRSREFGRVWFYRGYRGRAVKATGRRFKAGALGSAGQRPRPFIGIVRGDAAIGETADQIRDVMAEAISQEWERIGREGAA